MPSVSLCRVLCLIVCLAVAVPAQTRRRATPSKPPARPAPAAPVALPDDLAKVFPDTTGFYVEIADIASLLEPNGLDAQIYEQLTALVKASKAGKLPFTLAESRALLGTKLAFGAVRPTSSTRTDPVAVVRSPSSQTAMLVRDRLLPLFYPETAAKAKPLVQTEHGQKVVTIGPGTYSPFAFAVVGNDVVFGVPVAVSAVIALAAKKSESSLAIVPGFVEARRKLDSRNNAFVYIDSKPIVSSLYGYYGADDAAKVAARAEYKEVLGLNAISAFAFSFGTSGDTGSLEGLMVLDRSKESLLSVFTDPPPVQLRTASVLPANTDIAATFGFDPTRLVEFIDRKVIPTGRKLSEYESGFERDLKYAEIRVDMKLREEFLASLGHEFTIGIDAGATLDALIKGTSPPTPGLYAAIEVTNPDVARTGLARLFGRERIDDEDESNDVIESDDNGVIVARVRESACAVVDGYAIVGTPAVVSYVLQAYRSGNTLAVSQPFGAAKTQVAGDTVAIVYGAPRLAERMVEAARREMLEQTEALAQQADVSASEPTTVTVEKYSAGVHARMDVSAVATVATIGIVVGIAVPSLLAARRVSNESSAIGNIRTIASAEATFFSQQGRFGTLSELVAAEMLDSGWVNGAVRDGYRFTQVGVTKDTFEFSAEPAEPSRGEKAYNITEDYVIRYSQKGRAPRGKSGRALGT